MSCRKNLRTDAASDKHLNLMLLSFRVKLHGAICVAGEEQKSMARAEEFNRGPMSSWPCACKTSANSRTAVTSQTQGVSPAY
eukprot:1161082-Pelagomonas_calceolata.AAC.8